MAYERVNPCHPDKLADRIAGAMVDLAYKKEKDPKVAVEVLIGHGHCHIIAETDVEFTFDEVDAIVKRIVPTPVELDLSVKKQDTHLAQNQEGEIRCGDNGIFKGMPVTLEQRTLCEIAKDIYTKYPYDGKYILDGEKLIICQSNASTKVLQGQYDDAIVNPLGDWTGGIEVDSGCTNRKLGSDMADSVTGGGLHGKDLSKADVSINIYCWLKAQEKGKPYMISCAIGDDKIDGRPYPEIVEIARKFIAAKGGFEKFAEWGLL